MTDPNAKENRIVSKLQRKGYPQPGKTEESTLTRIRLRGEKRTGCILAPESSRAAPRQSLVEQESA